VKVDGGNVSSGSTAAGIVLNGNVTAKRVILSTVAANAHNNGDFNLGGGTFVVTGTTSATVAAGGTGSIIQTSASPPVPVTINSPSITLSSVLGSVGSTGAQIGITNSAGAGNLSLSANAGGDVQIDSTAGGTVTVGASSAGGTFQLE